MNSKALKYMDYSIGISLFIFFICEHHKEFTAIKNVSLYLALFLSLILFFTNKKEILVNIKENFLLAKAPLLFLSVFLIYAFIIGLFPYADGFDTLGNTAGEFGRGISFLFIILVYASNDIRKPKLFFYSILVAYLLITLYYISPLISEFEKINSTGEGSRIINRSYSFYIDRFFIFGLLGILFLKNKGLKSLFILLTIIVIIMDILTGARGSWVVVIFSFFMFLVVLFSTKYIKTIKKNYKTIILVSIASIFVIGIFMSESTIFQKKIFQTNSSSRDLILKQRLPLLMDSNRAFWGLGYEERQYDQFLSDELDKGHKISMMTMRDGKRHWWNDEPFFIGNYYYFGLIGTLALFCSFVSFLSVSFREFIKSRNILVAGVFISTFAYIGIRGLVETYNLRILYLFYMIGFFILIKRGYKVNL